MASKFLFPLLLLLSTSQGLADLVTGASSAVSMSSCVQKLIVCQAYLKGSSTPPDSCCGPLKELVASDSQCLCQVFNNPDTLTSLGITQAGALALAKTCGTDADISVCDKGSATNLTSPPVYPAESQATSANSSTLGNATSSAATESPAENGAISQLAGSGVVALCFALIISKLW